MPEAFGAKYRCPKGHSGSHYFFDSKPEEIKCLKCDNKRMMKLIRVLTKVAPRRMPKGIDSSPKAAF